eukprot:scaffold10175_cov268-Chaetoceros_neogracile.AAC.12
MPSLGMQNSMAASLDVVISVGFVRSIVVTEAKRRKDWNTNAELDSIKAVVTAMVPATGYQAEGFLSSGPLESPKRVGEVMQYNAIFPLKRRNSNGAPTRITLPGLMQQQDINTDGEEFPSRYKRQTVELLITLVYGNEAIALGKTTLLITGEEVKTKQSDLPIDTGKKAVIQLKKKSKFPIKSSSSVSSNKQGDIAPTSFKYDRCRRKYQIEKDAVLRAYVKCVPSDPYGQQHNTRGVIGSISQRYNESNRSAPIHRNQSSIPKVITPGMGFEPSMGGSVYSNAGLNSVTGSYGRGNSSSPMTEYRDHSGRTFHQAGSRAQSNSRTAQLPSVDGNGSMHNSSHARTPPPGHLMTRQRSSSTPRQRSSASGGHGSAYGGSSYNGSHPDYSFSGTSTRGRSVSRGSNHQQYGGSSFGSPSRKPGVHQGGQYGGSHFNRAGAPPQTRSQSPHVMYARQY